MVSFFRIAQPISLLGKEISKMNVSIKLSE
jgi:hypothetical protein